MHQSVYLIGSALAVLAMATSARSDAPPETKKAPLHDELARVAGTWDATVTFRIGGKENEGKARCEAKWLLNGNFIQQEYTSNFMGRPLTILQLLSYDPDKKKLVEIHMTSLSGGALMNEGESVDGGKQWKLVGQHLNHETGKLLPLKTIYTFEDADHFTLDWFQPDDAGKETRVIHITHVRRK